ncbi:hypothetical protein C6I20_08200 [Aeromicrobium sp. A1-2]|uniref:hypothetical protein n=1 Tax=Aeromicrobium sp. A1-2 TaxID=2107713 RepID=UPI000E50C187|nr:hypothetical protein [Aeromicrobium sp. A1-2]AXT85168.1 hypothetical protein C6I20_08200 [Aeromicrobium sp. A1-2]
MSYLVVGTRAADGWSIEVRDVGTTSALELSGVEAAARALLAASGKSDAADVDLQLLLPDFEVDLGERTLPGSRGPNVALVSGVIALVVVVGVLAFVVGRLF